MQYAHQQWCRCRLRCVVLVSVVAVCVGYGSVGCMESVDTLSVASCGVGLWRVVPVVPCGVGCCSAQRVAVAVCHSESCEPSFLE